jgi:predicted nucleotidyltransferase
VDLESLLDRFVRACLDIFGRERVEGIILHGSALKGGGIPGYSDIDFMVFLAPDSFDEHGELRDESAFAMQERIGPLPCREVGFLDPQAYFYDARRLPT